MTKSHVQLSHLVSLYPQSRFFTEQENYDSGQLHRAVKYATKGSELYKDFLNIAIHNA